MAQQLEFQKSMMKEMSKMKKNKEGKKRESSKYYSDSDSSDSFREVGPRYNSKDDVYLSKDSDNKSSKSK